MVRSIPPDHILTIGVGSPTTSVASDSVMTSMLVDAAAMSSCPLQQYHSMSSNVERQDLDNKHGEMYARVLSSSAHVFS